MCLVESSKPSAKIATLKKERRKNVLRNSSVNKLKKKQTTIDSNDHKECPGCKKVSFLNIICVKPELWKKNSRKSD